MFKGTDEGDDDASVRNSQTQQKIKKNIRQ
jgi:hypothetical protein